MTSIPLINQAKPLSLSTVATTPGVEVTTTWNAATFTVTGVTFTLQELSSGIDMSPFTGQSANFSQGVDSHGNPQTIFSYSWPQSLRAGRYVAFFTYRNVDGVKGTTSGVLIEVYQA